MTLFRLSPTLSPTITTTTAPTTTTISATTSIQPTITTNLAQTSTQSGGTSTTTSTTITPTVTAAPTQQAIRVVIPNTTTTTTTATAPISTTTIAAPTLSTATTSLVSSTPTITSTATSTTSTSTLTIASVDPSLFQTNPIVTPSSYTNTSVIGGATTPIAASPTVNTGNPALDLIVSNFTPIVLPSAPTINTSAISPIGTPSIVIAGIDSSTAVSSQFTNTNTSLLGAVSSGLVTVDAQTTISRLDLGTLMAPPAITSQGPLTPRIPIPPYRPIELRALSPDSLRLSLYSVQNDQFRPLLQSGICSYRPEIISLMDFNSIYDSDREKFSAAGEYLGFSYEAKILRDNSLEKMIQDLKRNSDAAKQLLILENSRLVKMNNIKQTLDNYNNIIHRLNVIKQAFEIKNLPSDTLSFLTLRQFFNSKMLYGSRAFDAFSDTKILYQLLFDFRSMMEKYSISLLNSTDVDRGNGDLNPIQLDKTYGDASSFSFTIQSIQAKLPFILDEFNAFQQSLPINLDDRLKLLTTTLSKELRVSRGLSDSNVRTKLSTFFGGSPDGDPFDNLIGNIGNDIFETPEGLNSLASLMQLVTDNNVTVLPFEKRTVDDNQTSFVPGTSYFIDSILKLIPNPRGEGFLFNLAPLNDYTQQFSTIVSNVKQVINTLFQFDNPNSKISASETYKNLLVSMRTALDTLSFDRIADNNQLLFLAIFRLAATDNELKLMLFQYILLLALLPGDTSGSSPLTVRSNGVVSRLVREIASLRGLSYVRVGALEEPNLSGGSAALFSYFRDLTLDIETKINSIIHPDLAAVSAVDQVTGITSALRSYGFESSDAISLVDQIGGASGGTSGDSGIDMFSLLYAPIDLTPHTIATALQQATTSTTSNLAKELLAYAYNLDQAASIAGNSKSYVLQNDAGTESSTLTRFNQLSTSTIMAIVYEMFVSFTSRYFSAEFSHETRLRVNQDQFRNGFMLTVINQLVPTLGTATVVPPQPLGTATVVTPETLIATQTSIGAVTELTAPVGTVSSRQLATSELYTIAGAGITLETTQVVTDTRIGSAGSAVPTSPISLNALSDSEMGNVLGIETSLVSPEVLRLLRNPPFMQTNLALKASMSDVLKKVGEEDQIVQNVLHILDTIGDNLSRVARETSAYFAGIANQTFVNTPDIVNKITPSQLRTNNWIYGQYVSDLDTRGGLSTRIPTADDWNLLLSLLRSPQYTSALANSRIKFLTIGVPFGFTEKLADRVARSSINAASNFEQSIDADTVEIVVWKKSAEDDDIVFNPQRFTFDLSLYASPLANLGIDPSVNFDTILSTKDVYLMDYSTDIDNNGSGTRLTLNQLLSNGRWSNMTSSKKVEMFRNHIVSHLLNQHLSLSTGLRVLEDSFPMNSYTIDHFTAVQDDESRAILRIFLDKVKKLKPQQISALLNLDFSDPSVDKGIKDDVRLLCSSAAMQFELIKQRILNTKKFDRTFTIPINIDSFSIDIEKTNSTASGMRAFAQAGFQEKLNSGAPLYLTDLLYIDRSQEPNALILEDYFVTIETVNKNG